MEKTPSRHGLLFVATAATICQACFGWVGFNPTDEGFVLEGSHRILLGQVPHLDFSSIRPALSCYLHLPEVLLGGSWTLWLSRYVAWVQMAAIAWWWTVLLTEKQSTAPWQRFLLAGIALCLSAHTYPLTAIHTIDGLFFLTLAFLLARREHFITAGLMVGAAALCKQGFIFGLPILAIVYPRQSARLLLPGMALIGIYLLYFHHMAGQELWVQLRSQSGFFEYALRPFLFSPGLWIGLLAGILVSRWQKALPLFPAGVLLLALTGLVNGNYIGQLSFGIMGLAVGSWMVSTEKSSRILLLLAAAWMSGISVGYNSPALLSGPLMVYLLWRKGTVLQSRPAIFIALWIGTWIAVSFARLWMPYRDAPFTQLRYPVGEVVTAGKGLFTNEQTYMVLRELDSLKVINPGSVPVPDFSATWISSGKLSPLPSLWPNKTETHSPPCRKD